MGRAVVVYLVSCFVTLSVPAVLFGAWALAEPRQAGCALVLGAIVLAWFAPVVGVFWLVHVLIMAAYTCGRHDDPSALQSIWPDTIIGGFLALTLAISAISAAIAMRGSEPRFDLEFFVMLGADLAVSTCLGLVIGWRLGVAARRTAS